MKALTKIPRRQQKIERQLTSLFADAAAALPEDCLSPVTKHALQNIDAEDEVLIERANRVATKLRFYEFLGSDIGEIASLIAAPLLLVVRAAGVAVVALEARAVTAVALGLAAAGMRVIRAAGANELGTKKAMEKLKAKAVQDLDIHPDTVLALSTEFQNALKTQKAYKKSLRDHDKIAQDGNADQEGLIKAQRQLNSSRESFSNAVIKFTSTLDSIREDKQGKDEELLRQLGAETSNIAPHGTLSLAAPDDAEGALSPVSSNDNGSTSVPKLSSGGMD